MSVEPLAAARPSAGRNASAYALALGFVAGAVAGPLLGATSGALQPVAAFALLSSLVAFSTQNLTRFALLSFAWFMATALLAAGIGTLSATALSVGAGYDLVAAPVAKGAAGGAESADWFGRLSVIVRGPAAHIVFWSLFAILVLKRRFGASFRAEDRRRELLTHCVDVAFLILSWIMLFAPVGVFALAAITFSRLQLTAAAELLRVFVAIYAGQVLLCLAAAVMLVAITRARGAFLRGIGGALLTAFATGSSAATAPVEIAAANERVGIDRQVAGLVIPLGLAVSKVGTAVFIGVVLVFAAAVGPQDLTPSTLVLLTLMAFAASVITPPISGGALVVLGLFSSDPLLPLSAIVIAATVPLAGKLNTPINSLGRLIAARVLSDRRPAQFAAARTLSE